MNLPIIDFSNLKHGARTSWESVKTQVREALEEHGCFEAKFDQIHVDLRASVLNGVQQLFDLPSEIKSRNNSDHSYNGYIRKRPNAPLYESLGIEDALFPGNFESFTKLMWPDEGNPSFTKNLGSFSEQLSELDKIVRRMVVESLGLEKYMDEHMDSTNYMVRVQKYDAPQSDEPMLGVAEHIDENVVTILYHNGIPGLEVQTKYGQWIPAGLSRNSFILMIGEAFSAWTNGRLQPPYHRVMMTGSEDRYSFGLFSIPKEGYIIKAPKEMVDEEHPLLFKPYESF